MGPLLSQLEGLFSSLSRANSWVIVHSAGIIAFKVRKHIYIFKATDALSEGSLGMGLLTGRINLYQLNTLLMYILIMLTISIVNIKKRFPRWLSGKESTCPCMRCRRCGFRSLGQEELLEEETAPTPVFLPGKSHGQRSLVGYSPWGYKVSDTTEQLSTHTRTHTNYKQKNSCVQFSVYN